MQRIVCPERDDWHATAEGSGFDFHTIDGERYWDESAYYAFSLGEIEQEIEAPTAEIDAHVPRTRQPRDRRRKIPAPPENTGSVLAADLGKLAKDEPSLYGRLDLSFDGKNPAKLLEYNADTPTSIFEAAVFQWTWLEQAIERNIIPKRADQFNSIHERLIEAWRKVGGTEHLHLAGMTESTEDSGTLAYLEDTATQAGLSTTLIDIEDIGLGEDGRFVDLDNRAIELVFKLYPWEWMFRDVFGAQLAKAPTRWIEPPWKAILSNKGILPLLWEMFPGHPNLLPAYFEDDPNAAKLGTSFVRKPLFSREGANVALVSAGDTLGRRKAPTAPKDISARPWRRCRTSPDSIRCSAAGSSITRPAACRSARTRIRSPAIRRDSCRTRYCSDALPREAATFSGNTAAPCAPRAGFGR